MTQADPRLESMLSKHEIQEVLMRYGRGVDRADEELLKSCYHADATEEHGSAYAGPAHAYIEGAVGRIRKMGTMAHYICNIHISLEGDLAYVEAYVLTFARFDKDGESFDTFTGGRICDRFERRDGEWKIAHRKLAFDWNRDVPSQEGWCLGMFDPADPKMNMGEKNSGDVSYKRF
jgi:ketosteroid isomerase-like protein